MQSNLSTPGRRHPSFRPVFLGLLLTFLSQLSFAADNSGRPEPRDPGSSAASPQALSLSSLMQVVQQLQTCVEIKDLASIHNEDQILGIVLKAMSQRLDVVNAAQRSAFTNELTRFAQNVASLHLAADLGQQRKCEEELKRVLGSFETLKSYFPDWIVEGAQKSSNTFTCPMHADVLGARTNACPKCGMDLDRMIRILPPDSEIASLRQSVRATIRTKAPLRVGVPCDAILKLEKADGTPVFLSDLIETHTKRIHLLINESSLTDYHHEHPIQTRTPGEYSFSFTPRKPGSYRAWADLRVNPLGLQEYVIADIAADTTREPLTDRSIRYESTVDGLKYELILARSEIKTGFPAPAKLRVTDGQGKPFTALEPVMATFAHIVGFNEDYSTILHMHPKGPPVNDPAARGGPELEFQIYSLKPGFYRLFGQVQIDGRSRFAPFGIRISR